MPADVKSYAWSVPLTVVIEPGSTFEVPTLGFETPENYDTAKTEVVLGAEVLPADDVGITWAEDFTKVTLTNSGTNAWEPGVQLSVTVPGIPLDTENIESSFDALAARVSAVEADVTDIETRLSSVEGILADHETRIAALETPARSAPDPESNHEPHKPGHTRAPQHRGSAKT